MDCCGRNIHSSASSASRLMMATWFIFKNSLISSDVFSSGFSNSRICNISLCSNTLSFPRANSSSWFKLSFMVSTSLPSFYSIQVSKTQKSRPTLLNETASLTCPMYYYEMVTIQDYVLHSHTD